MPFKGNLDPWGRSNDRSKSGRQLVGEDMPLGRKSSEYGGVAGLIQPLPHQPTPSEILMQIHNVDPAEREGFITPLPFEELPLIQEGGGSTHELPEPTLIEEK